MNTIRKSLILEGNAFREEIRTIVRDIVTMLKDFSIDVDKDKMLKEYKRCTEDHVLGFMLIDINAPDNQRFRCGFKEYIKMGLDKKNILQK